MSNTIGSGTPIAAALSIALAGGKAYFVLDDGTPIPGPRSRWQPDGVNGLSRTLDHAAFEWSDRTRSPVTGATAKPVSCSAARPTSSASMPAASIRTVRRISPPSARPKAMAPSS